MTPELYTIECLEQAPLSSWSEPHTLTDILDRYYDQYLDQADDEYDLLTREEFTPELFQDMWNCRLVKENV